MCKNEDEKTVREMRNHKVHEAKRKNIANKIKC